MKITIKIQIPPTQTLPYVKNLFNRNLNNPKNNKKQIISTANFLHTRAIIPIQTI